jgi:hypothetical protein
VSRARRARVHGQRQHEEAELERRTRADAKRATRQAEPIIFAPAEDDPEPEPVVIVEGQLSLEELA